MSSPIESRAPPSRQPNRLNAHLMDGSLIGAATGASQPIAGWLLAMIFVAGAVVLIHALRLERRLRAVRSDLERSRVKRAAAEARARDADRLRDDLADARAAAAELERALAASEARLAERERLLEETRARLDAEFRSAASKMLTEAHQAFLQRADESFARHRAVSDADADGRRRAIDDLIKPMKDTLTRYEAGLASMRADQQKARGELLGRIGELAHSAQAVRSEAQKLSTALRAGPRVRGRWGEAQLRNVVELAGMAAHVDFFEQKSFTEEDRRLQPDMVVALPGGRAIAVDSKVSINAFLDAAEATSDTARTQHLARHADDLWAHAKSLAAKNYAAAMRESLDLVVMFVPGENYFAAAMEARPQLFEEAFEKKVLIATPTTLLAILKSAAFGWRQEKTAENAAAIATMARDLYDSLRTFGGHLSGLGKSLEGTVARYNDLIGGVEARVMPRARRFSEFEAIGSKDEIAAPPQIETAIRQVRGDRDLIVPEEKDETAA